MKKRQISIESSIAEKTHQMFDTFSIDERRSRMEDIDKTMSDIHSMKKSAAGYLGAKSGLISGCISSAALVGTTLISGGLASLPIMGAVIAASGVSSFFINRKMNAEKIVIRNRIRKANASFNAADRQAYIASYKTETSDATGKSKEIFNEKRRASEKEYHKLSDILSKYAIIGTALKSVVVAGVVAAMEENIAQYLNKIKHNKTIIYITHNIEDVRDLQIDQALDLGKDEGDKFATMVRYDLRDEKAKEEYMEFFVDRNIGRSPSSPAMSADELAAFQAAEKQKMAAKSHNLEQKLSTICPAEAQKEQAPIEAEKYAEAAASQQMFDLKNFLSGYKPRE